MKENGITTEVLKDLRATFRGSVVIKHNDVGTTGIPDIQVCRLDRTSWGELKHRTKKDTLKGVNKAEQLIFAHQLATTCGGRAWVIIYEDERPGAPKQTVVWRPRELFTKIWPNVAGPSEHPGWNQHVQEWSPMPVEDLDEPGFNPAALVHSRGAFVVPGWHYDMLSRLIKGAHG